MRCEPCFETSGESQLHSVRIEVRNQSDEVEVTDACDDRLTSRIAEALLSSQLQNLECLVTWQGVYDLMIGWVSDLHPHVTVTNHIPARMRAVHSQLFGNLSQGHELRCHRSYRTADDCCLCGGRIVSSECALAPTPPWCMDGSAAIHWPAFPRRGVAR